MRAVTAVDRVRISPTRSRVESVTESETDTGGSTETCPYCATPLTSTEKPAGSLMQTCENPDCPGKHGPEHVAVD